MNKRSINMVENNFSRIVELEFENSLLGHKGKLILANSWGSRNINDAEIP
jgi:hypothetical protein